MIHKTDASIAPGLPKAIRWHRRSSELSMKDFAHIIDVVPSTVHLWERGITKPTIDQLVKIARLFNVSEQDLLYPSENILNSRIIRDEQGL